MRVCDLKPMCVHAKGDFHIFRIMRSAEYPHPPKNFTPVERKRSRQNAYRCKVVEHFFKKDAKDILNRLHVLKKIARPINIHHRRERHDRRVLLEILYRLHQRILCHKRVRIQASDNVPMRRFDTKIESGVFAAVFFVKIAYLRVFFSKTLRDCTRTICRAVVHNHDVEFFLWILKRQERLHCCGNGALFVIAWHNYRNSWEAARDRVRLFARAFFKKANQQKHLEVEAHKKARIYTQSP